MYSLTANAYVYYNKPICNCLYEQLPHGSKQAIHVLKVLHVDVDEVINVTDETDRGASLEGFYINSDTLSCAAGKNCRVPREVLWDSFIQTGVLTYVDTFNSGLNFYPIHPLVPVPSTWIVLPNVEVPVVRKVCTCVPTFEWTHNYIFEFDERTYVHVGGCNMYNRFISTRPTTVIAHFELYKPFFAEGTTN